jgi:hypothetical protein
MHTGLQKKSMPASWRRHNGVPRFFLNLRYRDRRFVDEDELAKEPAVHGYALATARDLIAYTRTDNVRNWFDCSFEVTDAAGGTGRARDAFAKIVNENEAPRGRAADRGPVNETDAL